MKTITSSETLLLTEQLRKDLQLMEEIEKESDMNWVKYLFAGMRVVENTLTQLPSKASSAQKKTAALQVATALASVANTALPPNVETYVDFGVALLNEVGAFYHNPTLAEITKVATSVVGETHASVPTGPGVAAPYPPPPMNPSLP